MARSKVKVLTNKGKTPKLGASSSSKPPSPLMPGQKRNHKKSNLAGGDMIPSFGETGMTGRS